MGLRAYWHSTIHIYICLSCKFYVPGVIIGRHQTSCTMKGISGHRSWVFDHPQMGDLVIPLHFQEKNEIMLLRLPHLTFHQKMPFIQLPFHLSSMEDIGLEGTYDSQQRNIHFEGCVPKLLTSKPLVVKKEPTPLPSWELTCPLGKIMWQITGIEAFHVTSQESKQATAQKINQPNMKHDLTLPTIMIQWKTTLF